MSTTQCMGLDSSSGIGILFICGVGIASIVISLPIVIGFMKKDMLLVAELVYPLCKKRFTFTNIFFFHK